MARRKMTYEEKIALLSEYFPNHPYKKGRRIIRNGKIYRATKDIEQGTPWNSADWKETKYDEYVGKSKEEFLEFKDIKVIPSAWYEWFPKDDEHRELFKKYPYRAFLSCKGVLPDMHPYVLFNSPEALSGEFANIAETVNKGVYIYCRHKPTDKIIVPLVKCLKENLKEQED